MAFLLTWKNVLPVLLKSANALLQVPHRNFSPGSLGDSPSRGPKQANRSSETARNFLRSAFRLLRFFPQTEHLKTSVYLQWTQLLPSKQNIAAVAPFCFPRSRLYGSAATRLRMHNSILLLRSHLQSCVNVLKITGLHAFTSKAKAVQNSRFALSFA